jgi:uncharacterized membrane protein (UPF0127 family)
MKPLGRILSTLRNLFSPGHSEAHDIFLQVTNLSRGTVLATHLEVADTSPKRNKGLLGRHHLPPGEGLWIVPCDAIHTIGMRFSIDLIYLDSKNGIKKLLNDVPPWRMSACLPAHSVLELPAGTIRETKTRFGDTLEFSSATMVADSASNSSSEA